MRLLSPGPLRLGADDIDPSAIDGDEISAAYAVFEPPPLKRTVGRPTSYDEDLGIEICRRVANGERVSKICSEDGCPDRITVLRWRDTHPEFGRLYMLAIRCRIEDIADECLDIVDNCTKEDLVLVKEQLHERHFMLANLHPARFAAPLPTLAHSPSEQPKQIEVALPSPAASSDRALVAIRRARLEAVK